MGSSGMKRKGRRHLPKLPGPPLGVALGGVEHSPYTPEGQIERWGAFARGLSATSRGGRRRVGLFMVLVVFAAPIAVGLFALLRVLF